MLLSIYIENIALIKKLSLEPDPGFCAFTGETGAGKSIIIDSLGLLCGARSDKDIIRTGEDEAFVEGIFTVEDKNTLDFLKTMDIEPEEDMSITVSRRLTRDGRSGAKINGRNIPLSRLRSAMSQLLSIHGQQDTQSFADTERQRMMLDAFAKNDNELNCYREKYTEYKEIKRRLESLDSDSREREIRLDMLRYKINELTAAKIAKGEKESLESERRILANSEKIISRSGIAYNALYHSENSTLETVEQAYSAISSLAGIVGEADELSQRLESVKYEIIDIAETVKKFTESDGIQVDKRLDECETRLEFIKKLELKYRTDSDNFQSLLEEWEEELDINENSEEEAARLVKLLSDTEKELTKAAEKLSDTRKKAAEKLCRRVTEELYELDMPGVSFSVAFGEKEFASDGTDEPEFLISANKGELPKPMAKIASGGELSRIMLCLKCVFADSEAIGTIIFDEIDTGVSGSTSEKIGKRLKLAANGKKTQVICVTHSAILASKADAHYKISKKEHDGRIVTDVEKLDRDGRINELARIMGGVNISESVFRAAEEMLK